MKLTFVYCPRITNLILRTFYFLFHIFLDRRIIWTHRLEVWLLRCWARGQSLRTFFIYFLAVSFLWFCWGHFTKGRCKKFMWFQSFALSPFFNVMRYPIHFSSWTFYEWNSIRRDILLICLCVSTIIRLLILVQNSNLKILLEILTSLSQIFRF